MIAAMELLAMAGVKIFFEIQRRKRYPRGAQVDHLGDGTLVAKSRDEEYTDLPTHGELEYAADIPAGQRATYEKLREKVRWAIRALQPGRPTMSPRGISGPLSIIRWTSMPKRSR